MCVCAGEGQEEAARVNVGEERMLELQPCVLLGEGGYAVIVEILTAKVMQGLKAIRGPVIVCRKGKKYPTL